MGIVLRPRAHGCTRWSGGMQPIITESIDFSGLTLEQINALLVTLSETQGTPLWIGEYGFWSIDPEVLAVAERFAADEDLNALGGAWWQWRQPCGDPHSLHRVNGEWVPHPDVTHLHAFDCASNEDLGSTEAFLRILGRGYPRVTAGRIQRLESNPYTGRPILRPRRSRWWSGLYNGDTHQITVEGIEEVKILSVEGGRIIRGIASQAGLYTLNVDVQ